MKEKILVGISSKANFNEVLEGLKAISGENNINISNELIQLEKPGYNNSIMATLIITISIVVIATIVVIYNAFSNQCRRTNEAVWLVEKHWCNTKAN